MVELECRHTNIKSLQICVAILCNEFFMLLSMWYWHVAILLYCGHLTFLHLFDDVSFVLWCFGDANAMNMCSTRVYFVYVFPSSLLADDINGKLSHKSMIVSCSILVVCVEALIVLEYFELRFMSPKLLCLEIFNHRRWIDHTNRFWSIDILCVSHSFSYLCSTSLQ